MDTAATATRAVDALLAEGLLATDSRDRAQVVVAGALSGAGSGAISGPVADQGRAVSRIVEVVAYLGAALVLAAGGLFLVETWTDLGDAGQIGALVLVALVLGSAGLVARGTEDVRRRLAGTLLTGAGLAAGVAVGLALELGENDWNDVYLPGVVGAVVVTLIAMAGYRLAPTAVGQLGMLGGTLFATVGVTGAQDGEEELWVGLTILVVGLAWLALAERRVFSELSVARSLGVSTALFGAQFVTILGEQELLGYALTAGLVVLGVVLYLSTLDWPYLAVAVIGVTLVVPEAVNDWTDGSLGAVGGVLIAGVALLLASFAGYRLREEATD